MFNHDKHFELLQNKYKNLNQIVEQHEFRCVYKASDSYGKIVIIKSYDLSYVIDHDKLFKDLSTLKEKIDKIETDNIPKIYEVCKENGFIYYTMKFVEGIQLSEVLNNKDPMDINIAIPLLNSIYQTLEKIHSKQIFHADINPSNIIISKKNNEIKLYLIDFDYIYLINNLIEDIDISVPFIEYRDENQTEQPSPSYDYYAFGVLCYHLLTGNVYDINDIAQENNSHFTFIKNVLDRKDKSSIDNLIESLKAINPYDDANLIEIVDLDGNPSQYYLCLDIHGNPLKCGDGTYGSVFKIVTKSGVYAAIKIFYKHKEEYHITKVNFDEDTLKKFEEIYNLYKKDKNTTQNIPAQRIEETAEDEGQGSSKKTITNSDANELEELLTEKNLDEYFGCLLSENSDPKELFTKLYEFCYLFNLAPNDLGKLINEFIQPSNALDRFKFEMESAKKIRNQLGKSPGIIEIIGSTNNFRSTRAFTTQLNINDNKDFEKLSNYALIMPYYRWTLKQILEETVISNDMTGYNILQNMNYLDRISTILPILRDIIMGIKNLRNADLFHHDLKPANIFVDLDDPYSINSEIHAVVGDLGFLSTDQFINRSEFDLKKILPHGSQHYLSVEQKYARSQCYVKVNKDEINNNVKLKTNDPKFAYSIMGKDDYIFFSKAADYCFSIANIVTNSHESVITINCEENPDYLKKIPDEDGWTQIEIYKNTSIRTDLYGIGAIAFDLVTCGKSPEEFYELIRSLDIKDTNNNKASVSYVVELYDQVSGYESEPDLIGLFKSFKHSNIDNGYAPKKFVKLILKCILYNVEGTYFSDHKGQAIEELLRDLSQYEYKRQNNNLVCKKPFDDTENEIDQKSLSLKLSDKIKKLYILDNNKIGIAARLCDGIWYLKKLIELIRDKSKTYFLMEIRPENIWVESNELKHTHIAYKDEKEYKKDLEDDRIYTKISQRIKNPFIPNFISYMRRPIKIYINGKRKGEPADTNNHDSSEKTKLPYSYEFLSEKEYSPLGNKISAGDFIVFQEENTPTIICIKEINSDGDFSIVEDVSINKDIYAFYYKKIDPCEYYFYMAGLYIYHIFFCGLSKSGTNTNLLINDYINSSCRIIDELNIIGNSNNSKDFFKYCDEKSFDKVLKKKKDIIEKIYHQLCQMYLRLTFTDNENSYLFKDHDYQNYENEDMRRRINSVLLDVKKLQESIAKLFNNLPSTELDLLILDKKNLNVEKIPDSFPDHLDFINIIFSLIDIPKPKSFAKSTGLFH